MEQNKNLSSEILTESKRNLRFGFLFFKSAEKAPKARK